MVNKIIDTFIFYNELDLLKYRLNILNDYVDYFVLVESTHTFTGKNKPLLYEKNKQLFNKFNNKIIHIVVDDMPFINPNIENNEQWLNENFQRNCIRRGLNKLKLSDSDIIIISDVDEIPNPDILKNIDTIIIDNTPYALKLDFYYYSLNNKFINHIFKSNILRYICLNNRQTNDIRHSYINDKHLIKNGGWHLSYFDDVSFIKNKLEGFSHQEYNTSTINNDKYITEHINNNKDLFNRDGHNLTFIYPEDNDFLPPFYYIYLSKYYKSKPILNNIVELMCNYTFDTKEYNLTNNLYKKYKYIKLTEENKNEYYKIRHCESISAYYAQDYKNGYESCKELLLNKIDIDTNNVIFNLQFYIQEIDNDTKVEEREKLLEYLYIFKNKISESNKDFSNLIWNYIKNYTLKYNKNLYDIENNIYKSDSAKNSNKILVYTGFADPNWNYTAAINGALGGSEKAVAFMTKELSKKYEVYISGDVIDEKFDNITYINRHRLHHLLETTEFHTIIISRYLSFFLLYPNFKCYKLLVAGHDVMLLNNIINHPVSASDILYKYSNIIDNIVVLTEWHKYFMHNTWYPHFDINKFVIINNGININNVSNNIEYSSKKIKNSFIYTSCSNRGLERLLELWPDILEKIPDATLNIASYNIFPSNELDNKLNNIIQEYPSIKHLGKLNEDQLHKLRIKSEFWLYPTNFTETSCITSLEMLLSEIVCIYYPLAGLTNTLGDYGIQAKKGEELQTILSLTEERKQELIRKGKEYALSCSWSNRAKLWEDLIFDNDNIKKIAIFNSFPFHYEVFGFILDYAKKLNYHVDMYISPNSSDLGWLEFYKSTFNNFTIFEYTTFNRNNNYELIFVTTDDDPNFKQEWVKNNAICLNHYYKTRNHIFNNYINIAKFRENTLDYIYPCYKMYNSTDKMIDSNYINIALVGSSYLNIDVINRLSCKNKNIKLHIFTREIVNHLELENIDKKFEINIIKNIDTTDMIKYLKNIEYILLTNSKNNDHNIAKSSSGATQLALSCLCKPIICESANIHLGLKNAITFDINSNDLINLDNPIDLNMLEIERDMYINNRNYLLNSIIYHNMYCKVDNQKIKIIPKRIIQSWETKPITGKLNKFINTWKDINNNYDYVLYDKDDRELFIEKHFTDIVVKTYKKLIPGAFKCDLFRVCELYINGGFYCDIDSLCISKIDNILCDNLIFAAAIDLNATKSEGEHNIANGFMLSTPYNPILLEMIHRIVINVENNNINRSILDFISCGVLGRSINNILQRDETDSFIGKEGIYLLDDKSIIKLLKFEKENEYIKNINGEILFQNKNGNSEIIEAYEEECKKLQSYKPWTNTSNIIDYSI